MKLIIICTFIICADVQVESKGCSLPIQVSSDRLPVILNNSKSKPTLALPHAGNIEMKTGERVVLTCPNKGNILNEIRVSSIEATCVTGETIEISNQRKDYQEVLCTKNIRGTAMKTNKECGGGTGNIIELGFPVEEDLFLTLIEVCYDADNGNTLYTTHELYGSEIKNAAKLTSRPTFSTSQLAPGVKATTAYQQKTQQATFDSLLNSKQLSDKYINAKSYLARGHLSPEADFLFASWKISTYFYLNTVPQWQAINNQNWKKIEAICRNAAAKYKKTMKVYTGGYGVLTLPDDKNVNKEIYLSNRMLAVPKFVWKILHSEDSGKAIAFVSLNNPFATELKTSDRLCTDVCDRYNWSDNTWNVGTKGFIYCCDARDLLRVISYGPKIVVRGTLVGP